MIQFDVGEEKQVLVWYSGQSIFAANYEGQNAAEFSMGCDLRAAVYMKSLLTDGSYGQ